MKFVTTITQTVPMEASVVCDGTIFRIWVYHNCQSIAATNDKALFISTNHACPWKSFRKPRIPRDIVGGIMTDYALGLLRGLQG